MIFPAVFILLVTGVTVNSDRHSLTYIYTAFSNRLDLPGIHKFTALGLLDDKIIDYYDSDIQKKVPRQDWMEKRLDADYWEKGTQSRQSKERWFKVNIDILMERMHQNNTDLHVLQWQHGCEGDMQPNGSMTFHRGMDSYSYDGNNFLFFDDANSVWVAPVEAAWQTKRKWDNVLALKDYTKGYLEKECIDWLSRFIKYGNQQLRNASRPDIYLFSKKSKTEANIILTCMATGFYPKHIILQIKRNDRILTREDGVMSTGPRPNDDDTYQQRDSVEILKSDKSTYKCIVIHKASGLYAEEVWDGHLPESPGSVLVVAMVLPLVLLAFVPVLLLILWKKNIIRFNCGCSGASSGSSSPSGASSGSNSPSDSGSKESMSSDSGVSGLLNKKNTDEAEYQTGQSPNPESEKMLQGNDAAV
ncbi:major histocompatibility complex class I-related gene protein-like isoform X2 [Thalassophryne amazonica]|uniref:major histocompatibility complex class I-related gene protein-like isoform X2 n=1 Tax=Thalassophryne amazonica TaxID=390379 RepID=UPI001472569E|nr:major histocompatibility complex class I-related gene protein-like isoform X2 [Thalassophryne amazonica]